MKSLLIVLFSTFLFFTSCKTPIYTPSNYEKEQLTFGNGGGFTGAVMEFTLLSNGQLFRKSGENYQEIAKLDKNVALQVFENYKLLKLDKRIMNDPGNMYYFIKRKDSESFHKILWGGTNKVDKRITIFFANLMRIVKNNKRTIQSASK